jgi:hypothetical protein
VDDAVNGDRVSRSNHRHHEEQTELSTSASLTASGNFAGAR